MGQFGLWERRSVYLLLLILLLLLLVELMNLTNQNKPTFETW